MANRQIVPAVETNVNLKLFPNPATDQITIQDINNKIPGNIIIFDAWGKMVHQKIVGSSQAVIDVKNLPSGVYYLRTEQSAAAIKFVKQ